MNARGGTEIVYLAFGSNLGDRLKAIRTGITALGVRGVEVLDISGIYISAPKYITDQPDFLNCVGRFSTSLEPAALLKVCQEVEVEVGRQPREKYGPRELDIDIILYGEEELSSDVLQIPHAALAERLFVLVPLAELAPGLKIPGHGPVEDVLEAAIESLPAEEAPRPEEPREGGPIP